VISSSPTDVQPVFETVVENAVTLCEAERAFIFLFDGKLLRAVASYNTSPELRAFLDQNPVSPGRHSAAGRVAIERRTVHIPDVQVDPEYTWNVTQVEPLRTLLGVPMLKGDELLGVIITQKREVDPFTDKQIELVETFADQAVIAMENVRQFKELQASNHELTESLAQQTATAEILRVISSSPTDLQPVFDTVVRNAVMLCSAALGGLHRIKSGQITLDAHYGFGEELATILKRDVFPLAISRARVTGRAILERGVVHIRDIREAREYGAPLIQTMPSFRTILAVPMLREGAPVGVLALWRSEVQPFTEAEIGLVQTFAHQAVIAIENVRLFTELQEKNQALTQAHAQVTEALEQQTATAEILQTISRTQADPQPVFETRERRSTVRCRLRTSLSI
jgi:two-component system NtrC family sensor kinase